jgi:ssDNA-binding Zn-finger/Zn-ribbon topoisomerase 1
MKAVNNPILKPCPFCGSPVRRIRGVAGLNFFKCTNFGKCGAVVSFDNDYYNSNPEQAYKAYNSRVGESEDTE